MPYKLLLVDDERFMLSYLKDCIPWDTLHVEVAACALNGEDAIEKTRLYKPDLIITDIVMPNMYGLEFIKNIYEQFKKTKIIILSGHQNFNFAKEALSYGVVDYIVKPSLASDIQAAVRKAINIMEQERRNEQTYQDALTGFHRSIPDIKRSFLSLLPSEPIASIPKQIEEKGEILGFNLKNCFFVCVRLLFYSTFSDKKDSFSPPELEKLENRLMALPSVSQCLFSAERTGNCLGILSLSESETGQVTTFFEEIIQRAIPAHLCMTVCISNVFSCIGDSSLAFHQTQHTLNCRPCSFRSHCYQCGEPMDTRESPSSGISYDTFISALRSLSLTECSQLLHQWLAYAVAQKFSMYRLRRELRALLKEIDNLLSSLKTGLSPLLLELELTEGIIQQEESLLRLEDMLNRLCSKIISRLSDCESAKYPPMIFLACQYLEEHYREKISVATLADQLYLTPNYLSALFKKHTGSSISEYITLCRIRKAKELMVSSSDMKAYEVAVLVGYNDYEHFRKVFKKYVGINPAQYRTEVILPTLGVYS